VFKIVTPLYNAGPWLAANVRMLQRQTRSDFHCVLADDCSTDDSVAVARQAIAGDSRFDLVCNRNKHYALGNLVTALERLKPARDDVIVLVDGDDRLYAEDVLARLAALYARGDCWLTYGSYTSREDGVPDRSCQPYPPAVVRRNRFRRARWHGSHLKTFRASLWRHVSEDSLRTTDAELRAAIRHTLLTGHPRLAWQMQQASVGDLLDPSGRWFRRCYDKAVMYPLLELAGARAAFVPEVVYWYQPSGRSDPSRGTARAAQFAQRATRTILALREPLAPLTTLD
jgi:glycosyltransferase involved in cell wall biosynthesis